MRRIGHRGAKGHAPDNTIESFEKAQALGCDEGETDVWLADDGRLLISHDRPKADHKLTLEEVLDFCRGKMGVNVELKSEMSEKGAQQTGARVGKLLAERKDPDVYASSFWWAALEGCRAAGPSVPRTLLFAASPDPSSLMASAPDMRGSYRAATARRRRRSSGDFHTPVASPARKAAPRAVVSCIAATSTGMPATSAWNCIRKPFAVPPPSTRRTSIGWPAARIASRRSRVWYAMLSRVARTIWARVVPRSMPIRRPRAYMSQCGAPSPVNAGTRYTLSLPASPAASDSVSAAVAMIPRPSRSHCTAAPVMNALPSSA